MGGVSELRLTSDRLVTARARRIALMTLVLVPIACRAPATSSDSTSLSQAPIVGGEPVPRYVQCMVDRGFQVTGRSGVVSDTDGGYEFVSDLPTQDALRIIDECRQLEPERPPLRDEEIRETYEDWSRQRECLLNLGYQPEEPPSFDTFLEDWRSPHGPWMPIDGIQYWLWTDEEYENAKSHCRLDFYERS